MANQVIMHSTKIKEEADEPPPYPLTNLITKITWG